MDDFSYLWILRCAGGRYINRNIEYKLIHEAPRGGIVPLIEVINENNLGYFYHRLREKYGEVWVDLPYYLAEESNFFQSDVKQLRSIYLPDPKKFFDKHKNNLDVPVVSAPSSYSFDLECDIYNSIKADFDKIAVRVRVPPFDITTRMESSLDQLLKDMRKDDVLLLDVFQFSSVESQVGSNIEKMNNFARKNDVGIYILNAFETNQTNCHNYGPLLTAYFSSIGFGDFATEERFKATGGRGSPTRKIRYYEPVSYTLWFITERTAGYKGAKRTLVTSGSWKHTSTKSHTSRCTACYEVETNRYKESHPYWKRFKMLHYLNCLNEMAMQYSSVSTPEDLDPDGYNTLVKSGGEKLW